MDKKTKLINDISIQRSSGESSPNYYAILPASVRYNSDLTYLERVLYAEISALSNVKGYCYASNGYFATNFKNSERTISRSINRLKSLGLISIQTEINSGREIRKIFLCELSQKTPGRQKDLTPPSQECLTSSINSNNTSNTNNTDDSAKVTLPSWLGTNSLARLAKVYDMVWEKNYGTKSYTKLNGHAGVLLKRLLDEHSEIIVALMIILHFEWRGLFGKEESIYKRLQSAGFPLSWVPNNANLYRAYIKNNLGIDDDVIGLKEVEKALARFTKPV